MPLDRDRGFTLVELLVVISILAILASLAVVGVMAAIESGKVGATQATIHSLVAAVEAFESKTRSVPKSSLNAYGKSLKLAGTVDDTNSGIECLLAMLRSTGRFGNSSPFFDVSANATLANADNDEAPQVYQALGIKGDPKLFEVVDAWGNPIVYIEEADYDTTFMYMSEDGSLVQVRAMPLAKTGIYPPKYMIWSWGPNRRNENGRGDDITSWKKDDEDKKPLE